MNVAVASLFIVVGADVIAIVTGAELRLTVTPPSHFAKGSDEDTDVIGSNVVVGSIIETLLAVLVAGSDALSGISIEVEARIAFIAARERRPKYPVEGMLLASCHALSARKVITPK